MSRLLTLALLFGGIVTFFILPGYCFAQKKSKSPFYADVYYEQGLEYLNQKDFQKADSILTLSINLKPAIDAFVNRSIARNELGDTTGYCHDLDKAAGLGDKDAESGLNNYCQKQFTLYKDENGNFAHSTIYLYKEIITTSSITNKRTYRKFGINNQSLFSYEIIGSDTIYGQIDTIPEYPDFFKFLSTNVHYPKISRNHKHTGVVYLTFIVDEFGKISNVEAIKGPDEYLIAEAIRVLELPSMPDWIPAIYNGRPVKFRCNLPIRFSL